MSRGPGLFRRPEIKKSAWTSFLRGPGVSFVQSSSFARRSRSWSRSRSAPQRRGSSSGVGGQQVGDHGHPHPPPGRRRGCRFGSPPPPQCAPGGPQGPAGHKVDLRVRLAVRHLIPGDDGGKQGPRPVISIRRSVRGRPVEVARAVGDAPAPQQLQHLPTPGFIGTPSVSIRAWERAEQAAINASLGNSAPKRSSIF